MDERPNIQDDGWELESAEQRYEDEPATFHIPPLEERTSLQVGSRAKLLFLLLGHDETGPFIQCERMWVVVTQRKGQGYVGMLKSQPVTSDVLKPGDLVEFEAEHIASL